MDVEDQKDKESLLSAGTPKFDDDFTHSKAKLYIEKHDSDLTDTKLKLKIDVDDDMNEHEKKIQEKEASKGCCPATVADKVISIMYICIIIISMSMTVFYMATDEFVEEFISLIIVAISTWLGVIIGIVTIYFGGNVRHQANQLKERNLEFKNSIKDLKKQRNRIIEQLKESRNNVRSLTTEEAQLTESVSRFGSLVDELKDLTNTFPKLKNIFDSLDDTNSILKNMQKQSDRAKLFAYFFDVDGKDRDGKRGLSPYEYKVFLNKIPQRFSDTFKELGITFDDIDADHDGTIDKDEFEKAISKVLTYLGDDQHDDLTLLGDDD